MYPKKHTHKLARYTYKSMRSVSRNNNGKNLRNACLCWICPRILKIINKLAHTPFDSHQSVCSMASNIVSCLQSIILPRTKCRSCNPVDFYKIILHTRTLKSTNTEPLGKIGVTFPCLYDH